MIDKVVDNVMKEAATEVMQEKGAFAAEDGELAG